MKSTARFLALGFVLIPILMLIGCGGGSAAPTINPPPVISVTMEDSSVTLGQGETYQLSATVTGSSNTAVTWSLSECSVAACGTISSSGLYTAPSVLSSPASVTVIATSRADPTKFASCVVQLRPITVSISPVGALVIPSGTLQFTGNTGYDNSGVTWELAPGCSVATCGTLSNATPTSVTYTAPATVPNPPTVMLIATSITDPSKTAQIIITISVAHALAAGDYAFLFNGWDIQINQQGFYSPVRVISAGHFHADASGNVTNGVEDINSSSGVSQAVPFTGTYMLGANGRGSVTIVTAQGPSTYHLTVDASGSKGKFVKFDVPSTVGPTPGGTGYFELQDKVSFSLPTLAGPYAMGVSGTLRFEGLADWISLTALGGCAIDNTGMLGNGEMDVSVQARGALAPQVATKATLNGSFSPPSSSTGRGTVALRLSPAPSGVADNLNFAYYVISSDKMVLVQTDVRSNTVPVLSGEIRRQIGSFSAASFSGPSIFHMTGVDRSNFGVELPIAVVGQVIPDGHGSLTGIMDDNQYLGATNKGFSGSYTIETNGRSTMALQLGSSNTETEIAFFFGQNQAFVMQTSGLFALFGSIKSQALGPFAAASISGTFLTATGEPTSEEAENASGLTTFDEVGGITSTMDVTNDTGLHHFEFTGIYTVAGNGRGTLTFTSPPSNRTTVFWVISPTELVGIGKLDPSNYTSTVLEYKE